MNLCGFCLDEVPVGDERCAHPECPHGQGGAFVSLRLAPRTPTRPSLVGGPPAEVVPAADARAVPHIGTQPSLLPPPPPGTRR